MGTDCTPILANLFLFFYEYNYVKEKLKTEHTSALKWSHTARYVDDLLNINNSSFQNEIPNIYLPQLCLKKTTECPEMASFLDICIHNHETGLTTSVYDKRDHFNFYIVKFPHLDSNIPSKPAYGVYILQLVTICRIYDTFVDFNNTHVAPTARLIKQSYMYKGYVSCSKRSGKVIIMWFVSMMYTYNNT